MKAVVFHKVGRIRLEEVPEPILLGAGDAIIRLTASAICGTDLHFVRGSLTGMEPGTVLGHEGVGIVEEVGEEVRTIRPGDRVVVSATISCGRCERCQAGDTSQCVEANPVGRYAGTAFFGGPRANGSYQGLQAERARIPFADAVLVKLPDELSDGQAITLSDIFPTGYYGARLAEAGPGRRVAVFGCGPVGLFSIISARLLGAARVFAIDSEPSRLSLARELGAETINFEAEDPVARLRSATREAGVDSVIDAVGVDANRPHDGPAESESRGLLKEFRAELRKAAPRIRPQADNWHPGDAPTQVLHWAVESLRAGGTLGIVGVYPPQIDAFPLGLAMLRNLSVRMGICPHRRLIPELIELVRTGKVDPSRVITQERGLARAIEAYQEFDRRERGWIKVELNPQSFAS